MISQNFSNNTLLSVEDLTVSFPDQSGFFDVVRHISFSLNAGQKLCLVGESGCGKSMTALALLRLVPKPGKSSGSIQLKGIELNSLRESEMRHIRGKQIGMIFQEPMTSLNPVLTIGEQVAEPLVQHDKMPHREALEKAEYLFHQVGLPDPCKRIKEYPHQLSGGMRQRVMIAMALACDPLLLLADEPTTALDVTIQGQILDLLDKVTAERGMGLILITHDLGVVAETADEVAVMYAGALVEQAKTADLFANPLHPYTQGLIRSAPTMKLRGRSARLETIQGIVPSPNALPTGCAFRPRCPNTQKHCITPPPTIVIDDHSVSCWL